MNAVEAISGPAVLLRGRLSNVLDGTGVADARITLDYRQGGDWMPLPFGLTQRAGGWYAVVASALMVSAKLPLAVATDFRITARHATFQDASAELSLTAAQMTLAGSVVTVNGQDLTAQRLAGAPVTLDLALTPRPVMLGGLVISDNQPDVPVVNATVTLPALGGASVATDGAGRFRFDLIPMAQVVEVQIDEDPATATGPPRSTNLFHTVDFGLPVNQIVAGLITPPSP